MDRRLFLAAITAPALAACGRNNTTLSPTSPSPAAIPVLSQYPSVACWGTRIGMARTVQSGRTVREAIAAAGLRTVFDRSGLMTSFDGNTPSTGLVVLVGGEYYPLPLDSIAVRPGDSYAVYVFSGRHKTGTRNDAGVAVDVCS